jgi:hypothetical protein
VNEPLRAELLALAEADQDFRRRRRRLTQDRVRAELEREHARAARAAELVSAHGWPGRSLVGDDGAQAAWLLIQHADHDVELQERCLRLLADAVEAGEAEPRQLAYLTDRVRVNRGRPQLYGTQFFGGGDGYGVRPVDDPERLDERRASAGLEPFPDYEARMRALERGEP